MSHAELGISVLAALAVVLVATGVCGRLAIKIGQPRVVGEIVAGVLLGPSVFGALAPAVQQGVFGPEVKDVLYVLSTIGLTFFMFLVGAGIDHKFLDRRSVRRAATVAGVGLALPFLLGTSAGFALSDGLAPQGVSPVLFAVFLGGALAITAFPVLARILDERRMSSTRLGSLALVAAAIDDAAAWILLAIVVAVGSAGSVTGTMGALVGAALFSGFMLTVGRRLLALLARHVERTGTMTHGVVIAVLLVVLGCGWFTDLIGIHAVFGGFIAGLAMPSSPTLRRELTARLSDMNTVLLLPVFFVFSGLNTELSGFTQLSLLGPIALIMLVAFAGKYAGCTLAVRMNGFSWRQASAVGALMNARGLMVLIFINVGLEHGLIDRDLFAILVLAAVVTTAAALPLYRLSLPGPLEDAERRTATGSPDGQLPAPGAPRLVAALPVAALAPHPSASSPDASTPVERKDP